MSCIVLLCAFGLKSPWWDGGIEVRWRMNGREGGRKVFWIALKTCFFTQAFGQGKWILPWIMWVFVSLWSLNGFCHPCHLLFLSFCLLLFWFLTFFLLLLSQPVIGSQVACRWYCHSQSATAYLSGDTLLISALTWLSTGCPIICLKCLWMYFSSQATLRHCGRGILSEIVPKRRPCFFPSIFTPYTVTEEQVLFGLIISGEQHPSPFSITWVAMFGTVPLAWTKKSPKVY